MPLARTMTPPARTSRRPRAPSPTARGGRAPSPPRRPAARGRRRRRRACADRRGTRASTVGLHAARQRSRVVAATGRPAGCRARARPARRRRSVTGAAPSRSSWLVPAAARLRTEPGTAITSTDRSSGRLGRDQRAAPLAALDHHEHLAERGEDAVAQREPERLGRRARRPLRQQQPALADVVPTARRVTRGYGRSGPLPTTATGRPPATAQRAAVGGAVDALGQAGHDGDAGVGERRDRARTAMSRPAGWRCACRRCRPGGRRATPRSPRTNSDRPAAAGRRGAAPGTSASASAYGDDADAGDSVAPTRRRIGRSADARHAARDGRRQQRRHRGCGAAPPGRHGERLVGLVVGEQRAQPARPSSGRGRRARPARRWSAVGHHATTPIGSTPAAACAATARPRPLRRRARRRRARCARRAGRRSCGRPGGRGGSRAR